MLPSLNILGNTNAVKIAYAVNAMPQKAVVLGSMTKWGLFGDVKAEYVSHKKNGDAMTAGVMVAPPRNAAAVAPNNVQTTSKYSLAGPLRSRPKTQTMMPNTVIDMIQSVCLLTVTL